MNNNLLEEKEKPSYRRGSIVHISFLGLRPFARFNKIHITLKKKKKKKKKKTALIHTKYTRDAASLMVPKIYKVNKIYKI
jgi:hypothetical protein